MVDFVGTQVEVEVGRGGADNVCLCMRCAFLQKHLEELERPSLGDRDPAGAMTKR